MVESLLLMSSFVTSILERREFFYSRDTDLGSRLEESGVDTDFQFFLQKLELVARIISDQRDHHFVLLRHENHLHSNVFFSLSQRVVGPHITLLTQVIFDG